MEKIVANEINPETIFKCDNQGNLLPDARISKIEIKYKDLINELKEKIMEQVGVQNIFSIYVSGSVARGVADLNSDIDIFIVTKEEINKDKINFLKEKKRSITKSKLVSKIDIGFISTDDLIGSKTSFINQFRIKLLSACVFGRNFDIELPKFKLSTETASRLSTNIPRNLEILHQKLADEQNTEDIKKACRWIMKIILRNAFCLIMAKENIYTNSLDTMTKLLIKNFPKKASN